MNILKLSEYVVHQFSQQSPDGGITPMKLQKLLYYIKVWSLIADYPLVDAGFEHWKYGPVNIEVYEYYKESGKNPISSNGLELLDMDQKEKELIDFIVENYISFDAFTLSAMTHTEEPWEKTGSNEIISNESIISYYSKQKFAKNFQPFDLSNNPFYPVDDYSFILDMTKKDVLEITRYSSYADYKK